MQRINIESSDIVSIGFDEKSRTLEVEFNGGRVYQYYDVDPRTSKQFMQASSYGQFFNTHINNHYRYQQINEQKAVNEVGNIAFVSGNERKVRDLQLACDPFGIKIEQLNLPVDEIQSSDAEEIALKKAKSAYKLADRPVIVHDTFWNILALRGFPGAYMKDVTTWFAAEDFLQLMNGKSERTIICTDTVVFYDGKRHKVFAQNYTGQIAHEARGKGFFTLDQVVVMEGQTKTIAELEDTEARSSTDPTTDSNLTAFAKWLHLQRRFGKV